MNKGHSLLKTFKTFGLGLLIAMSLTACGSKSWKEEVQLSDGIIIVVERESIYENGGDEWASNRSGKKIKAYHIRFSNPDGSGKVIEWKTTKVDSSTYPEVPLVLDIVSGKPVIFTLLGVSATCDIYSKYVYQNGVWAEESLSEQFEQHATNLLFGSKKDAPSLINLQEKNKRNGEPGYREALKQVGPGIKACGE